MGAVSGKLSGVIIDGSGDVAELLRGNFEYGSKIEEYFSRHGGGAQETIEGAASGGGDFTVNFDPADPINLIAPPGRLVSMQVVLDDSGDVWSGSARIGPHKTAFDVSGKPTEVTVPFRTHGVWTGPST